MRFSRHIAAWVHALQGRQRCYRDHMDSTPPDLPSVSIIMPVRNEVAAIGGAIDACLAQDYGGSIEIVIADAMSNDGTRQAVRRRMNTGAIRIVDNVALSTPSGLNRAIEASSGEVIVRCDARAVLPPHYVRRAVDLLDTTGAANVGGMQRAVGREPIQRAIAYAMTNRLGVGAARFHLGGQAGPVDTVYLGSFRADTLNELGGFDETLVRNQDYELNIRIRDSGQRVYFHPDLVVDYAPRATMGGLFRQYFDYGRWKRRVIRTHPGSLRPRQAGPPVLVVTLGVAVGLLATPYRPAGLLVMGAYVATLAGVSAVVAVRKTDAAGLMTGVAVGSMHVAWGCGFLFGRRSEIALSHGSAGS